MKSIIYTIAAIVVILLVVPSTLVLIYSGPSEPPLPHVKKNQVSWTPNSTKKTVKPIDFSVRVFRVETGKIEAVPLEEYVVGVVSGEMPAEFEMEALKAQALAARTYIALRIAQKNFSDVPKDAHVTDTVKHQVYLDEKQKRERWGSAYAWKESRIRQAVEETMGQVLTYEGQPINAMFFSTSNGYTENSEEYWGQKIPYLRSVKVPWDTVAPRYQETVTMTLDQFEKKLKTNIAQPATTGNGSWQKVLARTTGQRVKEVKIGDKTYTGRKVRELLGLNSSHFSLSMEGQKVIIRTLGYGHGVGMSQWGANGMAKEGKTAEQIVTYFYKGVKIEDARKWVK
jgi:stage II sporulation protein D